MRGRGGRHETGIPADSGSLRAAHSAAEEGLLGLLKVCKKMSWRAQQAWCWGLGPGPKAGPMRQMVWMRTWREGQTQSSGRRQTDRHAGILQSRAAAVPDPSAADQG